MNLNKEKIKESFDKKRSAFKKLDRTRQLLVTLVILISIPVTVYLVRSFAIYISRAATADIFFEPTTSSTPPETAHSVMIDSGFAQVNFARVDVTFDPSRVQLAREVEIRSNLDQVLRLTSRQEANSTGKITIALYPPLGADISLPSGVFEFAKLYFVPATSQSVQTQLNIDSSSSQLVDSNEQEMTLNTSSAVINVNPAGPTTVATPTPGVQSPFLGSPFQIPADTIQAEDFDNGGEGVAYHDFDSVNNGDSSYRSGEAVDISSTPDTGGGFNVGYVEPTEWLEYTINVESTGTYLFQARVAHRYGGGDFHVEIDGQDITGAMTVPNTGSWATYQTIEKEVSLTQGEHVMRVSMDTFGPGTINDVGDFNYFNFSPVSVSTPTPITTPTSIPTATPTQTTVADTTLSLVTDNTTPFIGENGLIDVDIDTGQNFVLGVEININFDPNSIEILDVVPGDFFINPDTTGKAIDNANGSLKLFVLVPPGTSARQGTGTVATITYSALSAGSTLVDFDPRTLVAATGESVNVLKATNDLVLDIQSFILGDINRDGTVNLQDYIILFENFGKLTTDPGVDERADINGDGRIDLLDYVILFENFGRSA